MDMGRREREGVFLAAAAAAAALVRRTLILEISKYDGHHHPLISILSSSSSWRSYHLPHPPSLSTVRACVRLLLVGRSISTRWVDRWVRE